MRPSLSLSRNKPRVHDHQFELERSAAALDFSELVAFAQEEERAGRRQTAREAYEMALTKAVSAHDAANMSSVIRWIARTYVDGDADAALDCLEAALAIAEAWSDDAAAGHAMNIQAVVSWQRGDMDDAERLYLLARSRAIRAGDAKLAAMTAQNLGVLANIRGDLAEAEQQYTASLAEYRSLGLTTDVCVALNNLGSLFKLEKRWIEAEQVLLEGVQICESSGDTISRTQLDINLAGLWVERGEYVRAHGAVLKALAAAVQSGDSSAIGTATKLLGIIARETGNFDEAEEHFLRAEEVAAARLDVLLQAEIARERATLARMTGKNRDVLQQLNRAHRLFTQLRASVDLATVDKLVGELEQDFVNVARRWGESIEAKDRYTQGHCQRVAELACAIAKRSGMDDASLFWFRIGALLHDVGKIVIPPEVLNKPGKLDDAEWELMKSHTTAGVEMLKDIEFPWDVRPIVESHHERWDGTGYPHGIAGEDIPLIARILTIADVYDALTSVRSYKRALTHQETMTILRRDVGSIFDPLVFGWFEEIAQNWPARIAHLTVDANGAAAGPAYETPTSSNADRNVDDLTSMPMRRAFRETLEGVLQARRTTGRPVSMLIIDIDHFKLVNETLGHMPGDSVLRLVADQIRVNTRPSDYPARYAGDEFVVLLPGTRLEDACLVAERIREAVANLLIPHDNISDSRFKVTLSIGVACAPMHGETIDALFGAADAALYTAKRLGRNTVMSAPRAGVGKQEVLLQCFVGRDAERQRLRELFGSAAHGSPQVVVLKGEAGIGKSTLLKQLGPDVGIRAGAMLVGQCIEANVGLPYGPWADIVLAAHRAGLVPVRKWRELSRIVPELNAEGSVLPPGGSQRSLLEELEDFLRIATSARPLMIVLDDMQWADAASWDSLEFLLTRLGDQRMLTCVNIRPEDMSEAAESRLRRLSRSERCHEMALSRLSRDEIGQWLRSTLGGQAPSELLLEHVVNQSEGNAFYAVQTVRALVDERQLSTNGEGWQFERNETAQLPRAIGDLLARRIERLSRKRRDILAIAAVLGREFDPEALVASCDCDEADVHDALDEGLATSVLTPSPGSRPMLTFAHVQLTRALLHGMNPLRLRRMHERVARALEAMSGRDPAALAVHFDVAGASCDAYRTAYEAGKQSESVYAYESAAEFFRIARRHVGNENQVALVEWNLAQVEESAGHFVLAETHCDNVLTVETEGANEPGIFPAARRMRERLRRQHGAPAEQTIAACALLLETARRVNDLEEQVPLLIMLSTSQQRLGDLRRSEQLARDAVEVAERTSLPSLHADAVIRLGSVLLTTSPASAVPLYRRALDMFTRLGDRHGQLRCHINIGSASDRAGNHPAAEASYVTALEIGRDIRANDLCGVASLNLGVLLQKAGKFAPARTHFHEALDLFNAIGHQPYRLASLYNLAHLARTQHDAATALELYGACAILAENIRHVDVQIGAIAGIGLAELDLNTMGGAARQRERARLLIGGRVNWWFQGREVWEALDIRLAAMEHGASRALALLIDALSRAEAHDQYATLWLGAECAELFLKADAGAIATRDRLLVRARALGYEPLVAKLTGVRLRLVA
jgi:diguanylate cyclase (GGDEF)-like protein/putative nucleotidyltransferase with HDIG domain